LESRTQHRPFRPTRQGDRRSATGVDIIYIVDSQGC
jgi:hypothetical protein